MTQTPSDVGASPDDAECAATRESGFAPGTYAGEASQTIKDRGGNTVYAWKSLTITVSESGCLSWRGLSTGDITPRGEEAPNVEHVLSTCIHEGDGTIVRAGRVFKLAAAVRGRASGGTPTRFHVRNCPGSRRSVRAAMSVDLARVGCRLIGNAADPVHERIAEAACQYDRPFQDLLDTTITVSANGALRIPLTVADRSKILLHRVDVRRQ